jgi:hypothetical protein
MSYDKMKQKDVAGLLKERGCVMAGEKATQIWRLKQFDICASKGYTSTDGKNLACLKMASLKKMCAKAAIYPDQSQDELLGALIAHFEEKSASDKINDKQGPNIKIDAVAVAKKVLELDEYDDFAGILNIATVQGGAFIDRTTPTSVMRKAYLKLSLLIHPDKLKSAFSNATKAFQALVRAFDCMTSPEIEPETRSGGAARAAQESFKISRSNQSCYRTRVCCPRCKVPWSERNLEGNPDYYYNFLMMAVKQFTCATCLCEFGCMSAIHSCPHCKKPFEYSFEDYHRIIRCPHEKCSKKFGFYLFHASEKVLSDLTRTLLLEQAQRHRSREEKKARQARQAKRCSGTGGPVDLEQAFLLGLADECPRCGESLEGYPDEESQRLHLSTCDGALHTDKLAARQSKATARAVQQEKQEQAQQLATWRLLGADSGQLFLLDRGALEKQAKDSGALSTQSVQDLSREDLVFAIAEKGAQRTGVGAGSADADGDAMVSSSGRSKPSLSLLTAQSVPSNYSSLSFTDLHLLFVGLGLGEFIPKGACKRDLVDLIEEALFVSDHRGGETREKNALRLNYPHASETIALAGSESISPSPSKRKKREKRKSIVISDDDDSDDDYKDD